MINIPEKVRIGSIDYEVIKSSPICEEGQQLWGKIAFDESTISLDDKIQGQQCLEVTFLHELVHGMLYSVNSEHTLDETLIDELSKALHQVIRDNPSIFMNDSREIVF